MMTSTGIAREGIGDVAVFTDAHFGTSMLHYRAFRLVMHDNNMKSPIRLQIIIYK